MYICSFIPGFANSLPCGVPLAQRIARWTSNPKVLGSIPRWDENIFWPSMYWLPFPSWQQQIFTNYLCSFLSVVVITCASHAQGRRFEPGRKQISFQDFEKQCTVNRQATRLRILFEQLEETTRQTESVVRCSFVCENSCTCQGSMV